MSGPYDAGFYEDLRSGARRSAQRVVPLVLRITGGARSVIDVGCGSGTWLAVFVEHGVHDITGVEGEHVTDDVLDVPVDVVLRRDVAAPFELGRTFDLAVSLEVAEHLPEASAPTLVASLVALAPLVLFSAAAPHQGGTGHLNERWPDWWAALFAEHGYVPVDCIRRWIWSDPEVEWWYAQNTLVYARESELSRYPALAEELERSGTGQLSVVHPSRYLEVVEWGIGESLARWD